MEQNLTMAPTRPGFGARLLANPFVRIVLGTLLTFAPVPLTMIAASQLVAKADRVAWPQLLACVLVWCGYRFYVRRVEKRAPTELAWPGMGRELGMGVLIGALLVALTFAALTALGVYRPEGVHAPGIDMLTALAELVLVGLVEEMMFRGVVFGVVERSLGSKVAIGVSALLFALAHLSNDGLSVLAVCVLCAYGVMQAALYMSTRRLWACIGTHIGWNYTLGQVFSSTVSGHVDAPGLLRGYLVGSDALTGGAFGVEGSLVTLVLIALGALFWLRRAYTTKA